MLMSVIFYSKYKAGNKSFLSDICSALCYRLERISVAKVMSYMLYNGYSYIKIK